MKTANRLFFIAKLLTYILYKLEFDGVIFGYSVYVPPVFSLLKVPSTSINRHLTNALHIGRCFVPLGIIKKSPSSTLYTHVEFRKVRPVDYKLFQIADLICTMELLAEKVAHKSFSHSEMDFFNNIRDFKKNYLKHLRQKLLQWIKYSLESGLILYIHSLKIFTFYLLQSNNL